MVVNGTQPNDWSRVLELGNRYGFVVPSLGLHPWHVDTVDRSWKEKFVYELDRSKCAVGEIGLDRWIEGHDIDAQVDAFTFQLQRARERELPVSIHCLRAWGLLYEILKEESPIEPGFLLHSYGGPAEMIGPFVKLGARFSFSGYFALESRIKKREVFKSIPLDRLLIETDSPDMLGPEVVRAESVSDPLGSPMNSPLNLIRIYDYVAKMRGLALEDFAASVALNFNRLFRSWGN